MPFPASPSNNDVHKIGNRSFVYDSALGTWDQIRETDRTENKILSGEIGGAVELGADAVTGRLGSGVTFPSGHVVQTTLREYGGENSDTRTAGGASLIPVEHGANNYEWRGEIHNVAAGNDIIVHMSFMYNMNESTAQDVGGNFGVMRNGTTEIYNTSTSAPAHQGFYMYWGGLNRNNDHYGHYNMTLLDGTPAVGTNTYYLSYASHGNSNVRIFSKTADNHRPFICMLQEIQR